MNRAEELKLMLEQNTTNPAKEGDEFADLFPSAPTDIPLRGWSLPPQQAAATSADTQPVQPSSSSPSSTPAPTSRSSTQPSSSQPSEPQPFGESEKAAKPQPVACLPPVEGIYRLEEGQLGCAFEFLFASFLPGSQEIIVEDAFIRHTHQIYNFLRFCELVVRFRTCKKITLITSYENEAQKESMQGPLHELATSLYGHGIELYISFNNNMDPQQRQIIFSSGWQIKLDRGLDMFNTPTSKFCIGFCDLALRPVRETTIQIIKRVDIVT
jgi:hypothetical protein